MRRAETPITIQATDSSFNGAIVRDLTACSRAEDRGAAGSPSNAVPVPARLWRFSIATGCHTPKC
jgi:hypothetical protein